MDEVKKLEEVKKQYNEVLDDLELLIKSLPEKYKNNEQLLESLSLQYSNRYRVIKESINKPYFARIDFKEDNGVKDICYIGKVGVFDFDNNLITVDWRSPIASLYYDSNIGVASYTSPSGIITGNMLLKRQYDIENGKLIDYKDVDTVSNDEMLKPYLSVNASTRLKNIVSSIQKEQNEIIRRYIFDNMIVQGVAGSGKTTVALHRIAYLAYNYRNVVSSNQFMVIGPNKFFINYISSILPDLDVTSVEQLTYLELAELFLKEKIPVSKKREDKNKSKYKISLSYKKDLDKYLERLEDTLFLKEDFIIRGFLIFKRKDMIKIYNEIDRELYPDFSSRVDRLILLLSTRIKTKQHIYEKRLQDLYFDRLENEDESSLTKDYGYVKKEVFGFLCENELKRYFRFLNKKTVYLYKEFLDEDKNIYESDIPALMYIHKKIHGSGTFKNIKHTVVDEAQDYGKFHFYMMKSILEKSSFSIFGDLAQSIYDYKAISSWEEVVEDVFDNDCIIEYLLKSYRTTVEIMNEANKVLKHLGLKEGKPVIRHGDDVVYINTNKKIDKIKEILNKLKNKKYASIAIISRSDKEAKEIYNKLKDEFDIHNIDEDNIEELGGIVSISSTYSKGLEFDAVILSDVSEKCYHKDDVTDMKHLYVAMTRALHELYVLYEDSLFLIEGD